VSNEMTGGPIPQCAVTIGGAYTRSDLAGHYVVSAITDWHVISFIAPGYQPRTVDFQYSSDRDTLVNVGLAPLKRNVTASH
jgi:hypothetical protein